MSDKNSQNPLSGLGKDAKVVSAASIPEDANKSLPEGDAADGVVKPVPASVAPTNPPPGVVQDDNKPSNDHGQADPENNEISEFDESKKQAVSGADFFPTTMAEGPIDPEIIASFTSHPVNNFRLGKYQFTDGVLNFTDSKKLAKFEELLDDLPPAERNRVKKLDLEAAKRISAEFQANQPKATTSTDSSVGERGIKTKVGTGALDDGNGGKIK